MCRPSYSPSLQHNTDNTRHSWLHVVPTLLITLLASLQPVQAGPTTTQQVIQVAPADTTASEGSEARLECGVMNKVGDCQWTRDGFALGTDQSLPEFPRYRLDGCDLIIQPVVPLDEAQYQCQVSGARGVASVASQVVSLTVNCEPGKPYIVQAREGDSVMVEPGEEVELHCQSQGGKPPAEMEWWDGSGRRISGGMSEFATRMEDRKTWLTVSILKLTPQAPMTVHCTVFNDVFPDPKTSEPLEITLRGFIKPEQISFVKNKPLELLCNENETKKEKYKWILNGKELVGETENILNILQINESYDNSKVKCLILGSSSVYEAVNAFNLVYDKQRKDMRREKAIVSLKKNKISKPPRRSSTSSSSSSRRKVFTCYTEEEISSDPEYVWINGKLEKSVSASRKVAS